MVKRMRVRLRYQPIDEAIEGLERYVQRMERRYECSSQFAVEATKCGHMKETAEIARWLTSYHELLELRELRVQAQEAGTPTKTTGRSS
jgi:hypothetical protein